MDCAHAPDGTNAMRCPGFALPGGHAHSIERRGDMLVGPTTGHAAHDRQSVFSRRATMFAGPWLADTQFGMLAASPMDREHDVARIIVDIDDNVGDQCSQQLLAGAHRNIRRMPRCR